MKSASFFSSCLSLVALFAATSLAPAADRAVITVTNDLAAARPGAVIVVPFREVQQVIPDLQMFHFTVREALSGREIPSQVTNYEHDHRGMNYDNLVFQHDFAAGEKTARFIVEKTAHPVPPYASRVFARFVPERYDDFAWENDRIGHRMYGPTLNTPQAIGEQLRGSGIDVWAKRVRYLVVDRWYLKGHDQFHKDDGEGLDLYNMGSTRGAGGTGIWDGQALHTSDNFKAWRVLANGPLRAIFELDYAPWEAGNGIKVSETKRFTVDAGRNLDLVECTFNVEGADEVTVGVGITQHANYKTDVRRHEQEHALSLWEVTTNDGQLGIGVILDPKTSFAGFAEEQPPRPGRDHSVLILAKVRSGQTLRYLAGAGWDRSGDFLNQQAWEDYLAGFMQRLRSPLQASVTAAP